MNEEATMYEDRIARGIALLDEHIPDWLDRVNLRKLRLESGCDCVLGQTFAHLSGDFGYSYGIVHLGLVGEGRVTAHGFSLPAAEHDGYSTLTQEWREAIVALRKERAAVSSSPVDDTILATSGD